MLKRISADIVARASDAGKAPMPVSLSADHYSDARRTAGEGMVLLKNDNGALPLKNGSKVALFGMNQIDYVDGGGGAATVNADYKVSLLEGMQNKEKEGKISVYKPLADKYIAANRSDSNGKGRKKQINITNDMLNGAKEFADTAVISIGRFTEEGADMEAIPGGYYLSADEKSMIDRVCAAGFSRVAVVLNVATAVDTSWFNNNENVDAALMAWLGGMEGGNAMADILCGDVNPSGKLPDTLVKSYDDYPSAGFHDSVAYVNYTEDIYVGYRYFETIPGAAQKVNYPFGYGLSYTTFELSDKTVKVENETVTVTAAVKNTGAVSGKQVVQVYYGAPQGKLGKPKKQLAGFAKTKLLAPNESQTVTITFPVRDMASYDDSGATGKKSAYVLEAGDYEFYIGTSVRECEKNAYVYTVDELTVIEQLSEHLKPKRLEKRLLADGSFESLETGDIQEYKNLISIDRTVAATPPLTLADVYYSPELMYPFISQMSLEELCDMSQGQPGGDTGGIGNLPRLGVTTVGTADGPLGVHLNNIKYPATSWPCAIVLAATFDSELIESAAQKIADECIDTNIDMILGPALNLHRNPLCGRNFEYYSEDPLLTGRMAAAFINGVQSKGIGATAKHFAVNNKEYDRRICDSRVSERAAREIYLRGFKILVDEADPWAIMSSYNPINGVKASANAELLTDILRGEWHYDGMVMSDWDTNAPHVSEALAGGDVKMPNGSPEELVNAVNDENDPLTREILERNIERVLNMVMKSRSFMKIVNYLPADIENGVRIKPAEIIYEKSDNIRAEFCQDVDGGKSLGYCDPGQWVNFKVNVKKGGDYYLNARIATERDNVGFRVLVDDQEVAAFSGHPSTGGWQAWKTTAAVKATLPEGVHVMKIDFTGTVNLNWINFSDNNDPADFTELDKAIARVSEIDKSLYTTESVRAMNLVLASAKAVKAEQNVLQPEVDRAAADLNAAIAALVKRPLDFTALNSAVEAAKKLDTKLYTADSVKALADALKTAEDAAANADALQSEIDAAAEALSAAIAALVKLPPAPVPEVKAERVTVTAAAKSITVGGKLKLTATIIPANAENKAVKWTTSDSSVASVDANGVVTAKKAGKVTITATSLGNAKAAASIKLTVSPKKVKGIKVKAKKGRAAVSFKKVKGVKKYYIKITTKKGKKVVSATSKKPVKVLKSKKLKKGAYKAIVTYKVKKITSAPAAKKFNIKR